MQKSTFFAFILLAIYLTNCTAQKNALGGKALTNSWMDCDDYSLEKIPSIGKFELQTIETGNICVIKITQRQGNTFRLFMFNTLGFFKIFTSVPGESMLTSTSMQVYSLYPFDKEDLEFRVKGQFITVQTTSGIEITFDGEKSKISNVKGSAFTQSTKHSLENGGGINLKSVEKEYLLINHGSMVGKDPSVVLTNKAIVKDAKNKSCKLSNGDFLEEVKNSKDSVIYTKHKFSKRDFKKILAEKCPQLDLNSI